MLHPAAGRRAALLGRVSRIERFPCGCPKVGARGLGFAMASESWGRSHKAADAVHIVSSHLSTASAFSSTKWLGGPLVQTRADVDVISKI